jgi:hypothetical protein
MDSILPLDTGTTDTSLVVTIAAVTAAGVELSVEALGEPEPEGEDTDAADDVGPAEGEVVTVGVGVSLGVADSLAAGVLTSDAGADTGGAGG